MKTPLHLFALRVTKYSDSKSILSAYTLQHGRMAFAIPAGAGREASRRRALFMPMTPIECISDIRPDREIHTLSEPRALMALHNTHSNPVKSAICLFLAEVLSVTLRESENDAALWHYIYRSIEALDSLRTDKVANFHICFMMGLSQFLGISPDTSYYKEGMTFDMVDATFRLSAPLHSNYQAGSNARLVKTLTRLNYRNMHKLRLAKADRNAILDEILRYYTMHYVSLGNLKSLDVLRALF